MATSLGFWYFVGFPCGMQKEIVSFLDQTNQKYTTVQENAEGEYLPNRIEVEKVKALSYTPVFVFLDLDHAAAEDGIVIGFDDEFPIIRVKELTDHEAAERDEAICRYEILPAVTNTLLELVMKGWSKKQIDEMTRFCREAQGVSEEDEKMAEIALRKGESLHGMAITYLPHAHVETVIDRLFWRQHYPNMLIITPEEVFYYGFKDIIGKAVDFLHNDMNKNLESLAEMDCGEEFLSISRKVLNEAELSQLVRQFKRLSSDKFGDLM